MHFLRRIVLSMFGGSVMCHGDKNEVYFMTDTCVYKLKLPERVQVLPQCIVCTSFVLLLGLFSKKLNSFKLFSILLLY